VAGGYSATFTVVDNATKQIDAINKRLAAMRAPMERMAKTTQRFMDVSGLRRVADGFSYIGRAASSVLSTLTAIVPVLGTLTGAATITGMVKLVSSFAAWSRELVISADEIGTTTQRLQQMQDATALAGGSAEDMTNSLKGLAESSRNALLFGGDALGYFNRAHIALRDASGNLRSAADMLPEVIDYLKAIPNPTDRARAAQEMLGASGLKLVETLKTQGLSFEELMIKAGKFIALTKEQTDALARWRSAQAETEVAFTHLGQQISATLAQHFEPLLTQLNEFVEKHTPDIIKAVGDISDEFSHWIDGIDWNQAKEDLNGILKLLQTMLDVAQGIFKAIEKTMVLFGLANRRFTKEDVLTNSPFYANATPEQQAAIRQQVGVSDAQAAAARPAPTTSIWQHPLDWLGNQLFRSGAGNAPTAMDKARDYLGGQTGSTLIEQYQKNRANTAQLPEVPLPLGPEAGSYGTRAHNPFNLDAAPGQGAVGRFSYMDPTEHRQHTMGVFGSDAEGVAAGYKQLLRYQDDRHLKTLNQVLGTWATSSYAGQAARELGMDANAPVDLHDPDVAARVMGNMFKHENRGRLSDDDIRKGIQLATAPPVNLDTNGAAPNGQVSIQVTHSNPPPGAAVTATAQGTGLDLAPMKTEFASLGSP